MKRTLFFISSIVIVISLFSSCIQMNSISDPPDIYSYTLELVDGKVVSPDCSWVYCIEKQKGKDFIILNFADVQLDSNQYSTDFNRRINYFKATTSSLAERFCPDLITLSGDQCYGDAVMLMKVCDQMESLGAPWAPVFGNHDNEQKELPLQNQSYMFQNYGNCLFMEGPYGLATIYPKGNDAIGNYVINIVEIEGESFNVIKSLIFFNTGNNQIYEDSAYEGVQRYHNYSYSALSKEQINWYEQVVSSVQQYGENGKVSSGIILHMPPYAFLEAASVAYKSNVSIFDVSSWGNEIYSVSYEDSYSPEVWNEGYKDSFGMMHEPYGGTPYPDGFFDVVKKLGSTDFILAGHEHINNYCINYEGVRLVYAMKTGIGSYYDEKVLGETIITIADDGSATIRHELDLQ